MQTSESAPGQLAAAIAKAHPREVVTIVTPAVTGLAPEGLLPSQLMSGETSTSPETQATLAKLMGREPGDTETATGDS